MAVLVLAPADLVVAVSDGVPVRFAGIDIGAQDWQGQTGVAVTLEGVRGLETHRRDSQFLQAREVWATRRKTAGSDAAGNSPDMPGVAVLNRVTADLTDDVDTVYSRTTGQVAGDATEWRAVWSFAPVPPATATELRVSFTVDGEPTDQECRVRLTGPVG